ncbi:MAG: carboxypeptidase regulatory-like domain-containing protein [Elusimicrobia bacterium]|nr:carboxypeptidase regulatory-like domain-containing protein [Elusimicrobiota bacterium]
MFKLKNIILALLLVPAGGFCFKADAAPSDVTSFEAAPNASPGLVKLSWTYNENLPSGATMYIQYNTAVISWSTANAQIVFSTGPITASTSTVFYTAGVNVGRDGAAQFPAEGYYYHIWVGTSAAASGISPGVSSSSASVNVPPATVLTTSMADGAALVSFNGNTGLSKPALDKDGNLYVVTSTGSGVMLRRFSPDKTLMWERFYNNSAYVAAGAVAVDVSGVYMAGSEPDPLGNENIFLKKYDAAGNLIWHRVYHNPGVDQALAVAVDASGNVYAAGYISNGSDTDIWLGKYDAGGALLWSRTYNSPANGYDFGFAVAVDKSDAIVAGSEDRNDLGQGKNIWVRKYDSAGAELWTRTYNSPSNGDDEAYGVVVDNIGNIVVAGSEDRYDLSQGNNIWVGKYDANGNTLWTRSYNAPTNDHDYGWAVATDNFGAVYVSGRVYDNVGGGNLWVGKYGPRGQFINFRMFNSGGSEFDAGYGIRVSSAGAVNVIGQFGASVGVYYYEQPVLSLLSVYPGPYAGSVGLSWNYTTDLPKGSSYYAQASVSPTGPWDPQASTNTVVSTQAAKGSYQNQLLGGFPTSSDATGNITSPVYYFTVWTSTNGINFQTVGDISSSTAKTPYLSDVNLTLPDSSVNAMSDVLSLNAPIARDAAGNSYLAFGGSLNKDNGYAVRKYNPSGKLLWTRFYNSPGGAEYKINALTADASGNVYVAGEENPGPTVFDAFAAKINSDGSLAWSRTYSGLADDIDAFYAVAVDNNGAVYAAGQEFAEITKRNALLNKYSSTGTVVWTSIFPWVGGAGNVAKGIALYGDAVYVTGKKGLSPTNSDIFLHKYSLADGTTFWAVYHGLADEDNNGYGVAADASGNVYVAGRLKALTFSDAWLGKYKDNGASGALVLASTYNSVANGGDMNFAVTYAGGYIYTAGYETRGDISQGDNIRMTKVDPVTLDPVWAKTFDAGNSLNERAHSVIAGNDGNVYAGITIAAFPGLYQFSPPYFNLLARPGNIAASAEVYWTMPVELPKGSTYYVQYSTFQDAAWSAADAQTVSVTAQTVLSGSFQTLAVPSLDVGRNAAGGSISPLYYFRAWYKPYGDTVTEVSTTPASSYASTPGVSDSAAIYPDSKVFTINQTYGRRNKIARDANGYIYAVANRSGMDDNTAGNITADPAGATVGGVNIIVLRKYNPDLSVQWTKFFGGAPNENLEGRALALDGAGNIYVTGSKGAGDSPTKQDILVIKYDSAGNRLWYKAYDYSGDEDNGYGIAAGNADNFYIAGSVRKPGANQDIFIGMINSSSGAVVSSITINGTDGYDEGTDIVFDSTAVVVYAVGSVEETGQYANIWLGKYNDNLGLISSATINGGSNGQDNGYGVAADGLGNAYVTGSINNSATQGNDILVAKYDSSLNNAWQRTYNDPGNNYDAGYGIGIDAIGGVYVVGSESRWDINQSENLFIRKYSAAGDTIWTRTFNASGSSYESGFDVLVDSLGVVYVGGSFNNGCGIYRYKQLIFSNTNPMLTVFINSVSAPDISTPMAGTGLIILPFDATGGVNPELISIGTTDSNGKYAARLPAGFQYFIGISTPGYKPTIKDQMMDPYGSFMVNLSTYDVTKQYKLYPKPAAETAYTLNIEISGGMESGDYAMAEVFYAKTSEKAAYGVGKSTALNTAFPIHNVPPAAAGVYGVNINIPGKNKAITIYLDKAFPSANTYTVDMTNAISMAGFDVNASTVPPSFQAVVRNTDGAPLDRVRVEISQQICGTDGCSGPSYENMTDVNGRVSFYNLPISTGNIEIRKTGYRNAWDYFSADSAGATIYMEYVLELATYTLTGILKYNGTPLPNARVMAHGDWNGYSIGDDSYLGNNGMESDAKVNTGADGLFALKGLTDGNVRLNAEFMGVWRELNRGNNSKDNSDDVRIVISSQGAVAPLSPFNNQCKAGRTWALNAGGSCLSAGSIIFNIMSSTDANAAGTLYGDIAFITTYTVTKASPLEIYASSPVVVMVMEQCDGGCADQKLGFASISGVFITNVATYSVTLSTGVDYWSRIYSTEWGQDSSFNDQVNLSSTDTARMDFMLTKSGALKGVLKLPDGTSFKPRYTDDKNDPTGYWADIEAGGQNVQVYQGTGLDEYGGFEFPNLAPGKYTVKVQPRGAGFRWPPAELNDVVVAVGKTTEIKLRLEDGLVVQPQIFGLPELSTKTWRYKVIGVPSGFQMNQRNITEMFFEEPKYTFDYDTAAGGWDRKYLPQGQYDFYLLVTVRYNPGDKEDKNEQISYHQFANFIGRAKNVAVQKSDSNPGLGSFEQPIPLYILGSVGQGEISGSVKGINIFTDPDYERIFANFEDEIVPLIPAVMLYDTAGDLRGFGHALPDEKALPGFWEGVIGKNKELIIKAIKDNPLKYLIWGVPPGRYTAVFANPNYPPLAKEIELPANESYNFDFDSQNILVGEITGVVRSSATGEALEDVTVYLKHRTVEKFTVTDSSGDFSFANLPSGIYRLEATRDGFVKAGMKTSLTGNDSASFKFYLLSSVSRITGKVYLSKFPSPSTKDGIKIVAYDETMNVEDPGAYLPKLEAQTDENGSYELTGIIAGHTYKISAFYEGKTPETLDIDAVEGDTVIADIVLRDIPPQIMVKVRKSPDSASKVDVIIKSPKQLVATPVCKYNPGKVFDSTSAVSMALVPGPNNSYYGQFTVSSNKQYYTIYVAAGDGDNRMEKYVLYDKTNEARTEQYIQDEAIAGGEISMDAEKEEYSGIELDAGALTTLSGTADFSNLVGGFFSALPNVRTVKTAKGNLTIESALKDIMASEVYNMNLDNADA